MNSKQTIPQSEEPPQSYKNLFIENKTGSSYETNESVLCRTIGAILDLLNLNHYELNVLFVSREEIQELNKQYRFKDKATDVLSFPQTEFEQPLQVGEKPSHHELHNVLGDLIICPHIAAVNAENIGNTLDHEIAFLMVHGILHLGGHDHIAALEEKAMIAEQKKIMAELSQNDDPIYTGIISALSEVKK